MMPFFLGTSWRILNTSMTDACHRVRKTSETGQSCDRWMSCFAWRPVTRRASVVSPVGWRGCVSTGAE